jgi:hypothetical protein
MISQIFVQSVSKNTSCTKGIDVFETKGVGASPPHGQEEETAKQPTTSEVQFTHM